MVNLNTVMAATTIVDYCLFGGLMAFFLYLVPLSSSSSSDQDQQQLQHHNGRITVWQSVWFLTTLLNLIHARDYLYLYTLPLNITCKAKREYKATPTDVYFVAKQYALFLTLTAVLTAGGYFDIQFDEKNPMLSIAKILLQFYAIAILKDNSSMRFLHPLMHGSWWKIHKVHHGIGKELRILTTFHGDWSDLVLETAGGPVIYLALCYLIGWPNLSMNIISWFCVVWMDINVHSINPYTVIFWNPCLDHIFKSTICHHLHHIFVNENMMFIPWHHLSASARQRDVQRYNKVLQTQANFEWLIPSDNPVCSTETSSGH